MINTETEYKESAKAFLLALALNGYKSVNEINRKLVEFELKNSGNYRQINWLESTPNNIIYK